MIIDRPDLTHVDPAVRDYIESLEAELNHLRGKRTPVEAAPPLPPLEPSEPPTTFNVITLTASGIAKRTPRHLYTRQRRGGMGIFDLDAPDDEPPAILTVADESQHLLIFTSLARCYRLPVSQIVEAPVRAKGQPVTGKMTLAAGETLVAALPDEAKGAVALVSRSGFVRYLRHHVFGEYMKPGASMFDANRIGPLAGICRTPGDGDLFIATRMGKAIRFSEKLVPPQGGPGIRLEAGDEAVAIASVYSDGGVFLVDADGKGTIRLMEGFNPNKSAGGGGKIAMNTDSMIAAISIQNRDDIFMISRLSKIVRFLSEEVPAKEGVVSGVNCMAFRADAVVAAVASPKI